MSIGLKRIQVHLCGFSSSQIWNIAWQDWCSLGRIDAQYSVPKVATGNDEDYKQCWCCFYGSTTDWIPLQNWLCRGPGRWLNGRLTNAILPVGIGGSKILCTRPQPKKNWSSKCKSEPMSTFVARPVDGIHTWTWREATSVSVLTRRTWKVKA